MPLPIGELGRRRNGKYPSLKNGGRASKKLEIGRKMRKESF
jgi:hypothetical protein